MEEYFARRTVVMDLIDPARLGRIKVLLQGKDVPDAPLHGLHGRRLTSQVDRYPATARNVR